MSAPIIIPLRAARRLRRRLPPVVKYIIAGTGAAVLLGLALYLGLEGETQPALVSALCVIPIAIAVVAQVLGSTRRGGSGPVA